MINNRNGHLTWDADDFLPIFDILFKKLYQIWQSTSPPMLFLRALLPSITPLLVDKMVKP
jgi:hypothetical protein